MAAASSSSGSGDWQRVGVTLLALLLGAQVALHVYERLTISDLEKRAPRIARPKATLPFFHDTFAVLANATTLHDYVVKLHEDAGENSVQLKLLTRPTAVALATPELFEDILSTQFEVFEKGPFLRGVLSDVFGDGVFAVDGPKWMHQRKTASTLFSLRILRESMTESVHKYTTILNKILRQSSASQTPMDLMKLMNRFTIDTFAEIGFGLDLGSMEAPQDHPFAAAFDSAQRILIYRFVRPEWFWKTQRWLNVGMEGELKRNISVIHDTVVDIIAKALENRRSSAYTFDDSKKDIVSLFLNSTNYDGSGSNGGEFDPKLLRDIVVNFLIAGRDTTAQTLVWFLHNVMQNPHVEEKIREELTATLPELMSGSIESPSMEQSHQLVYLEAAIRESLRLFPPVPGNLKQATKDVVLCDGTFIKKGWSVSVAPYTLARMKKVWGPDAGEYKPERWIDQATGKMISVSAYKFVTFNAGPRICLGMNLAMTEAKIVAASLLSKFRLKLVPGQTVTYDFALTLPVKGALMVNVEPAATWF